MSEYVVVKTHINKKNKYDCTTREKAFEAFGKLAIYTTGKVEIYEDGLLIVTTVKSRLD